MERSARWLRVSTKKQDEGSQVPDLERWEEAHAYDVKKTYTVHGGSAFKGNRKFDEAWAQVIKDLTDGLFTVLVVWKLDRIDRKEQAMKMIREVVEAGGRVEFVTQTHLNDLATLGGKVSLTVEENIAHEESRIKSDRVKAKQVQIRADNGIIGRPPFGYSSEGVKYHRYLVPTPKGVKYIPEIFKRCIAGDSLVTIAKWLDSEGIKTDQGRAWSNTSLKHIINNRTYMGYRCSRDGRVIGTCEAIIDAGTFKSANDKLKSRPKRGPILPENRALCAGLKCLNCGVDSPMYRMSAKDGPIRKDGTRAKAYFYRCAGRGAQRKGCGVMVKVEVVDEIVDEMMSENHLPITKRIYVPGRNHAAEIADVDFRITQLSPEGLSRAEYMEKLQALWDEKERYEGMEDVSDDWTTEPVRDDSGNVLTYADKWVTADLAGRHEMLEGLHITFKWDVIDGIRHPVVTL